jgi:flotillin
VLEGKLREIVSKMSVEEIYMDREKFASQVQEVAALDLAEMGMEIKAFTIRDISDANGYLEALGKKRIAEVKRDANIAEAEANMETKIKTADANREGEAARLVSETQIAESTMAKELKVQAYRKDQETEKAKADLAYEIEASKVQQVVETEKMQVLIVKKQKEIELAEEEMKIQIVRKQREIELAEQEALRMEKELEATVVKQADADKYSVEKKAEADKYSAEKRADSDKYKEIQGAMAIAEAIKLKGQASAEAKRAEGMAEVEIIRLKGIAEAEAMAKKAEAFKQYNDAAVTQMIIEKLPEIAKAVADPLSKTEKIVVIDSGNGKGNGAAKVSGYVTDIMASLPETVNALTGINLMDVLKREDKPEIKEVKIEESVTSL